ncbi:CpsD/CapB family tyrosine-protein kinase [Halobacillus salinarum]|uniref:non-specific protein-tyrosine kinase n=1 Tax=Halobacillus salinarum TaxID=2932257 RepID=A0ABY4ENP4_9BACI|nr:CpsD/CapB family tyrosine-protein kinase [Halobacillus salinarum]UOQ45691.1 CpsD/CapB family tyrosine-protein kinase [Halobacillus salinarum]
MRSKKRKLSNKVKRTLITDVNPRSPISEQYRTVRTNLNFSAVDFDLKTMMVTSSGPAEGKSLTTANLAIVFSQQGNKVLLIDADLRKPTVHYTFHTQNTVGLSNYLIGDKSLDEITNETHIDNLDTITCGPIPPNPSELLGSKAMKQLIRESKNQYDLVVFDTPPVLAVTDAQIISSICDGTLLVVRNKQAEIDQVKRAKELLDQSNGRLLGTVLNDVERKKQNYYYYGT